MDYNEWQDDCKKHFGHRIKRNAIKCLNCGDVIESEYRHDFKFCSCKSVFVDGGHSYIRVGGNLGGIEFLTEYEDDTKGDE